MSLPTASGRVRAFGHFVIAGVYFLFAQVVATHAAAGLSSGEWSDLVERAMLLFLLLVGYGLMGKAFQQQPHPFQAMGLVFRPGWRREFGLGAALGWGMLLASILPLVLLGELILTVWAAPRQFFLLVVDLAVLAIAALAEEVAFRGYPFQRLVEAIGPTLATLVLSALFGLLHGFNPGAGGVSLTVTVFAGWLLCAGYLRTRALWFSWGWHFAWNASMGVLFGLPISGLTRFSPVIQSNTIGPAWITGGDYGPEGSLVAAIVILVGCILVFRITRSYAYNYAQPVILPAGMPVNPDAMGDVLAPRHPIAGGEKPVRIASSSGFSAASAESPTPPAAQESLPPEPSTPAGSSAESRSARLDSPSAAPEQADQQIDQ